MLSTLRRALQSLDASSDLLLLTDRMSIRLDPGLVTTDVAEFEQAVRAAAHASDPQERARHLSDAVGLYRGELLPGYYDDWIPAERARLAETYVEVLCRLATTRAELGDTDGAPTHARRAVASDPLREESHCDLMRVYALAGRPSEATRQYRELERVLCAPSLLRRRRRSTWHCVLLLFRPRRRSFFRLPCKPLLFRCPSIRGWPHAYWLSFRCRRGELFTRARISV